MVKVALTTVDNPYNPFDDFTSWFLYDVTKGYNSCEYLARIAHVSDQLSDEENDLEIERAINEILDNDFVGIYMKIESNDKIKRINLDKLYENISNKTNEANKTKSESQT